MVRKYNRPVVNAKGSKIYRLAKRFKKYSARRRQLSLVDPFPMSMTKKLRYCEQVDISTGAAGQPGVYVFRANGAYDPNYAFGGHQPLLWDTYSLMYNHYVVLGAKIRVAAWSETAGTTYNSILALKLDDDASVALNIGTVLEQGSKLVKYRYLRTNPAGNHDIASLSQTFSAKKFFGIKDVKDNKQDIGALVTTNPTDAAYFCLFFQHPNAATNLGTIKCMVTIDYIIQFSEPRDLASS